MEWKIIITRLVIATIAGGIIGYEREVHHRPAGFRTHILVCIGATIIALIEINMQEQILELTPTIKNAGVQISIGRLSAQVISGIGFLGAGTIIHSKGSIKGLTTAASLWVVACIGLAVGYGYIEIAGMGILFSIITLLVLMLFQRRFINNRKVKRIQVCYKGKIAAMEFIESTFNSKNITIKSLEFPMLEDINYDSCNVGEIGSLIYTIYIDKNFSISKLEKLLLSSENIIKVKRL